MCRFTAAIAFGIHLVWALAASTASAADIDPRVRAYLAERDAGHLTERVRRIPTVAPSDFALAMKQSAPLGLVDVGTNGVVIKGSNGRVWKVSLGVLDSLGLVEIATNNDSLKPEEKIRLGTEWAPIKPLLEMIAVAPFIRQEKKNWPLKNRSLEHEVMGALLWSSFSPKEVNFPVAVASDGYAFAAPFISGPTLADVLAADRVGEGAYAMELIWAELARLQWHNEWMLLEAGLAVDIINPNNLIVAGARHVPELKPIDYGTALPQEDVRKLFAGWGLAIPFSEVADATAPFFHPLLSHQVVSNLLWDLSYKQVLDYVQAYFGLPKDGLVAERTLAGLYPCSVWKYPKIMDHQHIYAARRAVNWRGTDDAVEQNLNLEALGALLPVRAR